MFRLVAVLQSQAPGVPNDIGFKTNSLLLSLSLPLLALLQRRRRSSIHAPAQSRSRKTNNVHSRCRLLHLLAWVHLIVRGQQLFHCLSSCSFKQQRPYYTTNNLNLETLDSERPGFLRASEQPSGIVHLP